MTRNRHEVQDYGPITEERMREYALVAQAAEGAAPNSGEANDFKNVFTPDVVQRIIQYRRNNPLIEKEAADAAAANKDFLMQDWNRK